MARSRLGGVRHGASNPSEHSGSSRGLRLFVQPPCLKRNTLHLRWQASLESGGRAGAETHPGMRPCSGRCSLQGDCTLTECPVPRKANLHTEGHSLLALGRAIEAAGAPQARPVRCQLQVEVGGQEGAVLTGTPSVLNHGSTYLSIPKRCVQRMCTSLELAPGWLGQKKHPSYITRWRACRHSLLGQTLPGRFSYSSREGSGRKRHR